jgi:hypothetical protein
VNKFAFILCVAMAWLAVAPLTQGSQAGCTPEELKNPLRPSDPAYADAIGLAATLQNHGFTIQCVGPSKMAQVLPQQTGAAVFRTARGDFEALFRRKEQSFDDLIIRGKRDANLSSCSLSNGEGYHYTFSDPHGHIVWVMDGREAFFVRSHNILFIAWDEKTAATLTECFRIAA